MMNKKSTRSFSKVGMLIAVLKKCNGKAVVGDGNALIPPKAARVLVCCCLFLLTGALFFGAYYIQPFVASFIRIDSLAQALMLILLIMSFVLSIKDIVTVRYTADDLEALLPMPFSARQIVMAKIIVASSFPMILSLILLNSICLGYGIRGGAGVPYIIGTVLSSILIPVTGILAAALLVVIVFRVFGFIRNRDITVALGGIFTFGLSVAYIYINSSISGEDSGKEAAAAFHMLSSVSGAFPNIFFMNRFMFEGSVFGLLISLAVTAVLAVLAGIAVKTFYFDTALSMQNTAGGKKAVSKTMLRRGKKNSVRKALTVYEAKTSRRTPAYMIYGFAMTFFWPVLFALPFLLGNHSFLNGAVFPLDSTSALLVFISFAITASCFSCGFNILPGTAFSREGSCFSAIRALPVDLRDYYRSKRNFSLFICSLGSVLYVLLLGIVCTAAGVISAGSFWMVLAGACVSFLLNLVFINLMLLKNARKPQLVWDSETEFSRKLGGINMIIIVIGVLMMVVCLVSVALGPILSFPEAARIVRIICAAVSLAILVLAPAVNRFSVEKGAANLMKLE